MPERFLSEKLNFTGLTVFVNKVIIITIRPYLSWYLVVTKIFLTTIISEELKYKLC